MTFDDVIRTLEWRDEDGHCSMHDCDAEDLLAWVRAQQSRLAALEGEWVMPFSQRAELARKCMTWCRQHGAGECYLNCVTAIEALGWKLTPPADAKEGQ